MPAPLEPLVTADRLVHEPGRLAVLTILDACKTADFRFLQAMTGLAQGNPSGHLSKLEQGGLITITKGFRGKYPRTTVQITAAGRRALATHWAQLEASRKEARGWRLWLRRYAPSR